MLNPPAKSTKLPSTARPCADNLNSFPQIVVNARTGSIVVDERVRVAFFAILRNTVFISQIKKELVDLREIFSVREWCIVDDVPPAVRV